MNDVALRVDGLGKRYDLKMARGGVPYRTLREELMQMPSLLWTALKMRSEAEDFWALRDVSFEVKRGEVLGVIGRNGAGKSTLLKILSRIVEPTEGVVDIYGRVGSLLEVGTGFHPELTGRENIFLSGAILGMKRSEIRTRFDEIVAFAGVERFIDQAVKHYSSGMHARLAFAVAAHLETEILLMDEVLAVGDFEFQNRCLGKMQEVAGGGRAVLFVSHNLAAIRQLCPRCLWINSGSIKMHHNTSLILDEYMQQNVVSLGSKVRERVGDAAVWISEVVVGDEKGLQRHEFFIGETVALRFRLKAGGNGVGLRVKLSVMLRSYDGIALANMVDVDSSFAADALMEDQWITLLLDDIRLYPGLYYASIWVGGKESIDAYVTWEDAFVFSMLEGGGRSARSLLRSAGLFFLTPRWAVAAQP